MNFSVIIPTYNRAALLAQTLQSVGQQTCNDYEIIVVDDGSTDETLQSLRGFPGVKVLTQQNRGAGAARNLGASAAQGTYLAFLDSDDLWFPWTLAVYNKVAEQHGSPSFITGMPMVFETPLPDGGVTNEEVLVEAFPDYYASADKWRWFSASSFVIRKDAFASTGGFPEDWGAEDTRLTMKLGCSAGFVHVLRPYTFAYRNQVDSLKSAPTYSVSGTRLLIASERGGEFPGGRARARERRQILTRHTRPASLECLRKGKLPEAWELYRATFSWHVALGRWKYLAAFPVRAILARK